MEKFVLTANGKEVKVGDKLIKYEKASTPIGNRIIAQEIVVNERTITELLKAGIIKPVEVENSLTPMDFGYYIKKIADKMGWKIEKTANYINTVYSILPSAAFSMVLREIAIELDKKYEDHIQNSPEIYTISMFDGRITKSNKAHIKNYRNFAAFRSIEDAKFACRIVKPLLKEMFRSDSK